MILFVYFCRFFNNTFLFIAFWYLLATFISFFICPKMSDLGRIFHFTPFFVILSQTPKQIFELDTFFSYHTCGLFLCILWITSCITMFSASFLSFFLGITLFFPQAAFLSFLLVIFFPIAFVQFAQKATCQYRFKTFLFSLFSKNLPWELIRFPILKRHKGISLFRQSLQDVRQYFRSQVAARRIMQ